MGPGSDRGHTFVGLGTIPRFVEKWITPKNWSGVIIPQSEEYCLVLHKQLKPTVGGGRGRAAGEPIGDTSPAFDSFSFVSMEGGLGAFDALPCCQCHPHCCCLCWWGRRGRSCPVLPSFTTEETKEVDQEEQELSLFTPSTSICLTTVDSPCGHWRNRCHCPHIVGG